MFPVHARIKPPYSEFFNFGRDDVLNLPFRGLRWSYPHPYAKR